MVSLREAPRPLGIDSDGQLAMMAGEAATKMGLPTLVLGKKGSPASFVTSIEEGDCNSVDDNIRFAGKVRSIHLDTDHVNVEALYCAQNEGILVIPDPGIVRVVQNRILQKTAMNDAGIPTAPWEPVRTKDQLVRAFSKLDEDVIVKTAEGGYDGRGNKNAQSREQINVIWENEDFHDKELIVEKRMKLKGEVARILGQDVYGGRVIFPMVDSYHNNGMLDYTFYPSGAGMKIEMKSVDLGNRLLDMVRGPILSGFEMMVTEDDELVGNEYTARTHNTGHWTIEGTTSSQFKAIIEISSGMHLTEPEPVYPGRIVLMHNLNGGVNFAEMTDEAREKVQLASGYLHWYNKGAREQFPPRKRGHISMISRSKESMNDLMNRMQTVISAIGFKD